MPTTFCMRILISFFFVRSSFSLALEEKNYARNLPRTPETEKRVCRGDRSRREFNECRQPWYSTIFHLHFHLIKRATAWISLMAGFAGRLKKCIKNWLRSFPIKTLCRMESRRGKIETAASMTKTWNKFVAKVWNCGLKSRKKSEILTERAADKAGDIRAWGCSLASAFGRRALHPRLEAAAWIAEGIGNIDEAFSLWAPSYGRFWKPREPTKKFSTRAEATGPQAPAKAFGGRSASRERPQKSQRPQALLSTNSRRNVWIVAMKSQSDTRLVNFSSERQTQAAICSILLSLSSLDETESFE